MDTLLARRSELPSLRDTKIGQQRGARRIPLELRRALALLGLDDDTAVRVEGVPDDMRLSAGDRVDGNAWLLSPAELDDVELLASADVRDDLPLTIGVMRRGGGGARNLFTFGILVTADGATSAFSGLERDEESADQASIVQLRAAVGKGRGKVAVKAKRPLDFGDRGSTHAFVAQRSKALLDALLGGDLTHKGGASRDVELGEEQRLQLARAMWEAETERRIAAAVAMARLQWQDELDRQIEEMQAAHQEALVRATQTVRAQVVELVQRLSAEHTEDLAAIERRMRDEAEQMLVAARAELQAAS